MKNSRKHIFQNYLKNKEKNELLLKKENKRIWLISLVRVLLFMLFFSLLFYYRKETVTSLFAGFLLFLGCFWILVKIHARHFKKANYLSHKIKKYANEIESMQLNLSAFDKATDAIDPTHDYTYDLDVFGNQSLFQLLNRTTTPSGRETLIHWLNNHLTSKSEIIDRQEAVKELSRLNTFREELYIYGKMADFEKESSKKSILNWNNSSPFFPEKLKFLPKMAFLINTISFVLAWFSIISPNLAGTIYITILIVSFGFSKQIALLKDSYGKEVKQMQAYSKQLRLIEGINSSSKLLTRKKETLLKEKASTQINRLSKLMDILEQNENLFVALLMNGLFLGNLYYALRIEQWKKNNGNSIKEWLLTLGEIETLSSLATYSYNNPNFTFPIIQEESFLCKGVAMGHPLIAHEQCVCNDLTLPSSPYFAIVTGANMAGKSTYLRTVGINYLLACIGAPVYAKELTITPQHLMTSLRTTDSLVANESYFFAELKKLQRIILKLEAGDKLFIILDEILKGTNSIDKQKGSLALMKQFIRLKANGIIATHDLILGDLEKQFPNHIKNFCFEADIEGDSLSFSYKIESGVAKNMNACFLMKKMGIAIVD